MNDYPSHEELYNQLSQSMATEYANYVADEILGAVRFDIETSAGPEPNEDDMRLSIGRVLCARLGVAV